MSGLYEDFEKRYTNAWFSAGWSEVDTKQKEAQVQVASSNNRKDLQKDLRKDLSVLQEELNEIKENIESISQKQLRLANLAKFYSV